MPSGMGDYYCDSAGIGGVHCAEVDIQEANAHAWHSVVHTDHDPDGKDGGFGGGEWSWSGPRDWTKEQYSPGGNCVDTSAPFRVNVSFPIDDRTQELSHIETILSQNGCSIKTRRVGKGGGRHSYSDEQMKEISIAIRAGMTPVFSHYTTGHIAWLSGVGKDKKGACNAALNARSTCSEMFFSEFSVSPGPGFS